MDRRSTTRASFGAATDKMWTMNKKPQLTTNGSLSFAAHPDGAVVVTPKNTTTSSGSSENAMKIVRIIVVIVIVALTIFLIYKIFKAMPYRNPKNDFRATNVYNTETLTSSGTTALLTPTVAPAAGAAPLGVSNAAGSSAENASGIISGVGNGNGNGSGNSNTNSFTASTNSVTPAGTAGHPWSATAADKPPIPFKRPIFLL